MIETLFQDVLSWDYNVIAAIPVAMGLYYAWRTARETRRASQIAVYDKRKAVYRVVRDTLEYCSSEGSTPFTLAHSDEVFDKQKKAEAKEKYHRFISVISESRFLFGKGMMCALSELDEKMILHSEKDSTGKNQEAKSIWSIINTDIREKIEREFERHMKIT